MNALKNLFSFLQKYRHALLVGAFSLVLSDILGLFPPLLLKRAIDHVKNAPHLPQAAASLPFAMDRGPLLAYAVLLVAAVSLQMIFRYLWRKYLLGISRWIEYDLRNRYFQHLQKLHWGFFQHTRTGDLMSRATNDLQVVREFLGIGIATLIDSAIVIPTCLVLMLLLNVKLTILSLLPMAAAGLVIARCKKAIRERSGSVQEKLSEMTSAVHEHISGIQVIQAYTQEPHELSRFRKLNLDLIEKKMALARMSGIFSPLMVFTTGVTTVLILWIGGREVMQGHMTLGAYVAFTGYLAMFTWPLAAVGFIINLAQRGIASMRRIDEVLAVEPDMEDGPGTGEERVRLLRGQTGYEQTFSGALDIRSLFFSYDNRNNVLSDIDLNVPAGGSLSLVGPVGSGKSTLVKLVPRIYDCSSGSIRIDGQDTKQLSLHVIRGLIGYVDQMPFLFSDTIRENITFGARAATGEEIDRAVAAAGLDSDLRKFPRGLDTLIGERGVTLSGGQKQRVALARALIKKPTILILDDAFSNLDADTEDRVFSSIRDSFKDTTLIIISHRISIVRKTDAIAFMKDGRIVEAGTHDDLVSQRGFYDRIVKQQLFLEKEIVEE
jgi:ATP-binding cassette subfamily B multidrug efflux pump